MHAVVVAVVCLVTGTVSLPLESIQKTFSRMDADLKGYVTESDFIKYYNQLDDGDGHLLPPEFIASSMIQVADAIPVFKFYDFDNNGDISLSDVRGVFPSFDANNDGRVTSTEFLKHFSQGLIDIAFE